MLFSLSRSHPGNKCEELPAAEKIWHRPRKSRYTSVMMIAIAKLISTVTRIHESGSSATVTISSSWSIGSCSAIRLILPSHVKLPGVSDFIDIFIRPRRVFDRVRQKGTWVMAFLAVAFLLTLPTVLVISTAGIEMLTLQRYQHDPKLGDAVGGEPGIERAVSSSNDRWTKMLVVTKVAGGSAASLVLLAGAFTVAASIFDQRPNFFAMLGTVSYAAFPFALLGVLLSAILLTSGVDQSSLDLENMPALTLGRLFPGQSVARAWVRLLLRTR